MKRLLKDLKEIHEHPLENIAAAPLEKNVFTWHANIRGVDDSMKETFHFILQFPASYPNDPPSVTLCTPIPHPNVFSAKIGGGYSLCMDMLEEGEWSGDLDKNVKFSGWSSAYSVQLILVQLQAFLLDAQLQYATHKSSLVDALTAARTFSCKGCSHNPTECFPPLPTPQQLAERTCLRVTKFVPSVRPAHMDNYKLPVRRIPSVTATAPTTPKSAPKPQSPTSTPATPSTSTKSTPTTTTPAAAPTPIKGPWVLVTSKRPKPFASEPIPKISNKPNKSTKPSIFTVSYSYSQPTQPVQTYSATASYSNGSHTTNGISTNGNHSQNHTVQPKQQPAQNHTSNVNQYSTTPKGSTSFNSKDLVAIMLRDAEERKRLLEERVAREKQEEKLERARLRKQAKRASKKKNPSKSKANRQTVATPVVTPIASAPASAHTSSPPSVTTSPTPTAPTTPAPTSPTPATPTPSKQQNGTAVDLNQAPEKISWADSWEDVVSKSAPTPIKTPKAAQPAPTTVSYKDVKAHRINPDGLGNLVTLPVDTLHQIFAYLSSEQLARLSMVSKDINKVAEDGLLWKQLFSRHYPNSKLSAQNIADWKFVFMREVNNILDELACFHTKLTFEEDVLGVPINFTVNPRTEKVDYIASSLDILSSTAFNKHKIRKSPFKEPFTHFLPLYITEDHFQRALPEIKRVIVQLSPEYRSSNFAPSMALSVFGKLMNTMIVLVMDGGVAASAKALNGYMAFHRLLLAFVEMYPQLMIEVNNSIEEFIRNENGRVKSKIPSMGDWLALLSVSNKYSWKHVAKSVIWETFDRNVLWICKEDPSLATLKDISNNNNDKPGVETERLTKSFEYSKVSKMLLLFQSYFLTFVAHPQGMSLAQVADNYDRYFGRPSYKTQDAFQRAVKKIQAVRGWPDFFLLTGLPCPSQKDMTQILRDSVRNSKRKGYHNDHTNFKAVQASGTSVILKRNDKFSAPSNLEKVIMGLGWGYEGDQVMFLDASCFEYTKEGQFLDVVHFSRTDNKNKSIVHSGDKVNHEKRSVEHTISLTLSKIRPDTEFLVFTITSYNGTLAAAKMPWVRMSDGATSAELCQYVLDKTGHNTAAIMCVMQRNLTKRCWDLKILGKLDEGSAPHYTPLKANIGTLLTGGKFVAPPSLNAKLAASCHRLLVSNSAVALSLELSLSSSSSKSTKTTATGRWVIVVLDNSGSMSGSGLDQAKPSINELAATLLARDPSVKFSIVVFNSDAKTVYSRGSNLVEIQRAVNAIFATGGTDFVSAFDEVSAEVSRSLIKTENTFVVFLTDGEDGSSIEERRTSMKTLAENLEENTAGASLHTLGFTSGHDARLLGEITAIGTTQGTSQYIADSTNIKPTVGSLVSALSTKNAVVGKLTVGNIGSDSYFERRVFFTEASSSSFTANAFIPAGLLGKQVVLVASSGEAAQEFVISSGDSEEPPLEQAVYLSVAYVKDSLVQLSQKLFGQTTPSSQELQQGQAQVAEFNSQVLRLTKLLSSTMTKSHKQIKELGMCLGEFQNAITSTKTYQLSNEAITKLNSLLYKSI